ncbi:energy-coupling factor ABC transporter ATP-binding protein [Sulfitobacter mediterraneus]|uniref:Biotin transport system ATP-binding protein n=1 Tax=Sulfitobacter mediterraneus TaxID=83219 RepID=A0A2T6CJT7_9RHOB|nr:biotin transport system ATP-binding protein [Sulfitobacter mediterraneus]
MKMQRVTNQQDSQAANTLRLVDVSYDVDGRTILDRVSCELTASRIGVVGRNGSGKSTLARLLAGLVSPTRGELHVNGLDLAKDRKAALDEVGILFQNPDHQIIFPTVEEEIAFGLRQQGYSKNEAARTTSATLSDFGKSHWSEAHISALSQGQKHLVCMMAIIAMKPRLIILDEPFTGLDIPTKAQLTRYLRRYQGGLLHITHDPSDLSGYEQIVWLEGGTVRSIGDARSVMTAYEMEMAKLGGLDDISDLTH